MGINNTLPDFAIDSTGELSDARNYQPDLTGQGWLIKREGVASFGYTLTAGTTYGIYFGVNFQYAHLGAKVYQYGDGTAIIGSGLASAYDSWASMQGYDCFTNGTDRVTIASDKTAGTLGCPSGTKYIASQNNFMYAAGATTGTLTWCNAGDITTWAATNSITLTNQQNDNITALCPIGNGLGVWTSKSFYIITGWSNIDQEVSYFTHSDGCLSNRSVCVTPYGVFWWTRAGIAWMGEGYQIRYPMLGKLAKTLAGLNRAYDAYVHAVWDADRQRVMFWLFNGSSQATVNLRCDFYPGIGNGAFFLHSGAGTTHSASGVGVVSGVQYIYVGEYSAVGMHKILSSTLTDAGAAIAGYFETAREGNPGIERNGSTVILSTDLTGTETITYAAYIDVGTSVSDTYARSITTAQKDVVFSLARRNKRIKHRVSDSATATRTRITQLTHTGQAERVR